jgi:hypothetical protein
MPAWTELFNRFLHMVVENHRKNLKTCCVRKWSKSGPMIPINWLPSSLGGKSYNKFSKLTNSITPQKPKWVLTLYYYDLFVHGNIYINAGFPKAQEWVLAFSVLNESWCLMVDKFQKQNCQSDEEEEVEEEEEQLS